MSSSLAIGDFSRATHLTVKTLRHYHRIGLLVPTDVDPATGHRRYGTDQIPTAQVIKRFRALDMPLEEIHAVIAATDLGTHNELIAGHLCRLEITLARMQVVTASLRDLLDPPAGVKPIAVEHRRMPATPAAAVSEWSTPTTSTAGTRAHSASCRPFWPLRRSPPAVQQVPSMRTTCSPHRRGQATVFYPLRNDRAIDRTSNRTGHTRG
jgi:DNA-binding transcriptional MerR regulator